MSRAALTNYISLKKCPRLQQEVARDDFIPDNFIYMKRERRCRLTVSAVKCPRCGGFGEGNL